MFYRRRLIRFTTLLTASLQLAACGDDDPAQAGQPVDASTPSQPTDAATVTPDSAVLDASVVPRDGGTLPKSACELLSADELTAALGVPQKSTSLAGGLQCEYASTDTTKKDARALLEVVGNASEVYAATLQAWMDAGKAPVPQSGIGERAAFLSDSMVRSAMITTVGNTYLRLNIGWSDPGVSSDTQLAAERSLLGAALTRL